MHLNTLKPAQGSKPAKQRVGRGIGSGKGKTAGRGHKGQHSRSGGYHKVGFEGGQMPLQRRIPKFGFNSRRALVTAEIRLHELKVVAGDVVDMKTLLEANLISRNVKHVKIFAKGEIKRALTIKKGIRLTKGALEAIVAAGGKVEE